MTFRSKSAHRAMDELVYLNQSYPGMPVAVVDNILDMKYFDTFIPLLEQMQLDVDLFYEVKANLKFSQLQALRRAGIRRIQPGIESFSNEVLSIMKKGVTGLQNIQLLKWCAELGIQVSWNILYGFPGESPLEYDAQAQLIPRLTHLEPPTGYFPIRMDRFSPNFNEPEKYGFANVRAAIPYNYLYPHLTQQAKDNIAYYFQFDYLNDSDVNEYTKHLRSELRQWQTQTSRSICHFVNLEQYTVILDSRKIAFRPVTVLNGTTAKVFRFCLTAKSHKHIISSLRNEHPAVDEAKVSQTLQDLVNLGLVYEDHGTYLSLPLDLSGCDVSQSDSQRIEALLGSLEQHSEMAIA